MRMRFSRKYEREREKKREREREREIILIAEHTSKPAGSEEFVPLCIHHLLVKGPSRDPNITSPLLKALILLIYMVCPPCFPLIARFLHNLSI